LSGLFSTDWGFDTAFMSAVFQVVLILSSGDGEQSSWFMGASGTATSDVSWLILQKRAESSGGRNSMIMSAGTDNTYMTSKL
jgi:hypothetical protein